jgi:hypothetical protein
MFHRDGDEFAGRVSAYLLGALREIVTGTRSPRCAASTRR